MTNVKTGLRLTFAVCLMLSCTTLPVMAQTSCQQELRLAEEAYTQGNFDETIRQADACLNKTAIDASDRRLAFRLKGLSYIGKGLEADAKEAVSRLIALVPDFKADPIQDPPAFVALIEEVKLTNANESVVEATNPSLQPVTRPASETKNRLESFYTNWGLGFPFVQYPDELKQTIEQAEEAGFSNAAIMLDLLGFYFPIGEKIILGTALNVWGDRYTLDDTFFQLTSYTIGASTMVFLQDRIGEGFFIRGDVGGARLVLDLSDADDITSDWGLGFRIGGGYGIPVSRETRILLHLNYSRRSLDDDILSNFNISLSGLF